jgi:hypothetical protein
LIYPTTTTTTAKNNQAIVGPACIYVCMSVCVCVCLRVALALFGRESITYRRSNEITYKCFFPTKKFLNNTTYMQKQQKVSNFQLNGNEEGKTT